MTKYDSPMHPEMMLQSRTIDPFKPEDWQPSLDEIILALPNINRYNGHTRFPYSVAQHSIHCMQIGVSNYKLNEPHHKLYFLLHDAAETYLQDIIRPIKKFSTALNASYMEAEDKITERVMALVMTEEQHNDVFTIGFQYIAKEIDTRMAVTEIEALMPNHIDPIPPWTPYEIEIKEYTARDVREMYTSELLTTLFSMRERN